MRQASAHGLCQDQPGLQEIPRPSSPAENAGSTPHQVQPLPTVTSPSTHTLLTSTPPADVDTVSQDLGVEVQPGAAEGDAVLDKVVNTSMLPHPEELSPIQAMEEEATTADATEACPNDPSQSDSVEMESPSASQSAASFERDQPEREHRSNTPSLQTALMELHKLLVSNSRAQSQSRATSSSPSHLFKQETDEVSPKPGTPAPENTQKIPSIAITAGVEPSDAKANHAAAVSDEGPSNCLAPDLSGQDKHLGGVAAETVERQTPPQLQDGSRERRADRRGQDEASKIGIIQPEQEVPPDPTGDLELSEPSEGQQGRASGFSTPDTLGLQPELTLLSPLSMAVGSPEEVSSTSSNTSHPLPEAPQLISPAPLLPSPHPFIEQFPTEHIQRIQAAGFSAMEAAEALEKAHGVVELALLALLARSITVPT